MKKIGGFIIAFILVITLVLVNGSTPVYANNNDDGTWSTGTEITIDLAKNPAPYTWLQLMGTGVKVDAPGQICRVFRVGQYNWVADMRHLVNGKWVKITTTQGFLDGKEASYMACGQAPAAGTYALFAYFTGQSESGSSCAYDTSAWTAETQWNEGDQAILINLNNGFPANQSASFTVLPPVDSNYISPLSETTSTYSFYDSDDHVWYSSAFFGNAINYEGEWTITIRFTVSGCSKDFVISSPAD